MMIDSTTSALGALVIALSWLRAADQLIQTVRHFQRHTLKPDPSAMLGTVSRVATVGYALTIGADRTLTAWIATVSLTVTWLLRISLRLSTMIKMSAATADKWEAGDV